MEFLSPIARLVQGGMTLNAKTDMQGKPMLDDKGQPIMEAFLAIAIKKDDPQLGEFYSKFVATARAEFPHLFDANGNCTNPKFAWKIQDGDGVDTNGQSVADKPGFAGHWIFKMATRYAPRCFYYGKWDASQQIQNPDEVIKKGYFVRVHGKISGNGVGPQERSAVPGLFVSPNMVELIDRGEEIVSGPDASKTFGAVPLPAGVVPMSTAPVLPGGGTATPSIPGGPTNAAPQPQLPGTPVAGPAIPGAPVAGPAVPGVPGAAPTLPVPGAGPTLPPPAPKAPTYTMQASAMGATREALLGQGWTDELLVQHGHMVIS